MLRVDSSVWAIAVGDKVLTPSGVRYLLVWDFDKKTFTPLQETIILATGMDVFPTENGVHLYARGLHTTEERKDFQTFMATAFPSDYIVGRTWSFVRPSTKEETTYLRAITRLMVTKWVRYYRDKDIWLDWDSSVTSSEMKLKKSHTNVLDSGWKATPTRLTGMN